jgi:uncharacterized protein YabN with tetrapyrrole methylase and pyrophosphatase domain
MIMNLKFQVEEVRRIEEILRSELEVKEKEKDSLETKIVSLRKEITKILDEIISAQRPYRDRSGLGYNQKHIEKGLSSMTTEEEEKQKTYVEVTIGFTKKEECKPPYENDRKEDYRRMAPSRRPRFHNQQPTME